MGQSWPPFLQSIVGYNLFLSDTRLAVKEEALPPEVRELLPYVKQGIAISDLREEAQQCLAWWKELYSK